MSKTQAMDKSIPEFKTKGIKFAVGSPVIGKAIQSKQITQSGSSPYSVVFADHGLEDMADTDYTAHVTGEGAGKLDQSTMATTGFDVIGGSNADVLHITLVGRVAGMIDEDGNL